MAEQKIKAHELIIWLTSILIGPALVHYILHHFGEPVLICSTPEHCKSKMLLFFIVGFLLTWAVYWSIRLLARLIKPPQKPDSRKIDKSPSNNDSLTFE